MVGRRFAALSAASRAALELPALLALVGEMAATDLGRARALSLEPLADAAELARRHRCFEEAGRLLGDGSLVPGLETPLAPLLARLTDGHGEILGPDLLELAVALQATREGVERVRSADPPVPALAELGAGLPDLAPLERRILRALDRRGAVREDASPQLASLRQQVRRLRDGLYVDLQRLVARHREHLAEETIPLRGGRLVLVLKAGAQGRADGLVHGRSASGKSAYFEPLEVVDGNNRLQQALEDEEIEKARILAELAAACRAALPDLQRHFDLLGELDLLQAAHGFARRCDGRLAEIAPAGELALAGARHPLLDPRLADLRERALGQPGHTGPVVPLDLALAPARRVLVVTGPNAGGKTVALKTTGLLALAAQCALPIPAAAGTRLPVFSSVVATVGDEQDLLADRSTFSARLLRLKEAWQAAAESLVLLDELGSGTGPEEGSALAVALLEGLLAKGPLGLITTHLTQLAATALDRPGASCAAMEFDPGSGAPTFRLLPGPPGGSEALALGRRLGLAPEWLARAEQLLGTEHRDLRRLLREVDRLRQELAAELGRAGRERRELAAERSGLESARRDLESERRLLAGQLKKDLEGFRRKVRDELGAEVARLRGELEAGRRRNLEVAAVERLFAAAPTLAVAPEEPAGEGAVRVAATVRHRALGWTGTLEKIAGERAEVRVRGKRLRCEIGELVPAGAASGAAAGGPRAGGATGGVEESSSAPAVQELNLIGWRVEPAIAELDGYLDQALLASLAQVRIVHGHGSGALREAVRQHLRHHPAVAAFRPGGPEEGGNGATVVALGGR